MSTLKTYLTAVDADADSAASVYWDKVESFLDTEGASDVETTDISTGYATSAQDATTILLLTANSADTGDLATTSKRSYLILNTETKIGVVANGVSLMGASAANYTASATLATSNAVTVAALINATTLAQADVAGVSIAATPNAAPVAYVEIGLNNTSAENSATAASSAWVFGVSDSFSISIDGYSATVTYTQYLAAGGASSTDLSEAFASQWAAKYGATGSVASESGLRWTLSSDTANIQITEQHTTDSRLIFTAKDKGTGSIDDAITVTFTAGGTTATHSNVGWAAGNANNTTLSSADNKAQGTGVVLTITADTAGDLLGQIGVPMKAAAITAGNVSIAHTAVAKVSELLSSYNANITASNVNTAANIYPFESRRNDVVIGDEANAAAASNAISFSRVGWLG
jgi:hypothetical protein